MAFCLVALTLTIRCLRLGVAVEPGVVIVRSYSLTRRVAISEVHPVGVIDYPAPGSLNSERLKGLRLGRVGRRPLTVW